MEKEVLLLREELVTNPRNETAEQLTARILYEALLLLEKMVAVLRELDNERQGVYRVPAEGEPWSERME